MNPKDFLKKTRAQAKKMRDIKKASVDVGVLASKSTGKIYSNGVNVLQVAAIHEFGLGTSPKRSFLKMPQQVKEKEISQFIKRQLKSTLDGKSSIKKGLGLIGVFVTNVSVDAFDSNGFGQWQELEQSTIDAKGSSQTLTDTGTLKNSITHRVNT